MILELARTMQDQISAWRRDLHRHPELSFQEFRTAGFVAKELQAMGLEVQTGVGKTGVVGRLGEGKPVVAIRADMDALPILEQNEVEYRSQNEGVMHACGHDAHTATLLAAARILSAMDELPPGEIRFLFQPAEEMWDEEGKSGATRMIEDGALAGVDRVLAMHVAPVLPAGTVMIRAGHFNASVDDFKATITAAGGHAAYPHQGRDPIWIAAQVINAIHGIRARRIDPTKGAVISIGVIQGGTASNILPAEVLLRGTIRAFDEQTRQQLWDELEAALAVSRALGGDYRLEFEKGYPALINDPGVTGVIEQTTRDLLGEEGLYPPQQGMGAEDFAFMAQAAPGAMFALGVKKDDLPRALHTPIMDLDESALPVGVAVFVETALRLLRETPGGEAAGI